MAGEICWGVVRGDGSVVNIYDDKAVALGWMRWGAFDKSYRARWHVDPYVRIAPGHYRPTVLNVLGSEVGASRVSGPETAQVAS